MQCMVAMHGLWLGMHGAGLASGASGSGGAHGTHPQQGRAVVMGRLALWITSEAAPENLAEQFAWAMQRRMRRWGRQVSLVHAHACIRAASNHVWDELPWHARSSPRCAPTHSGRPRTAAVSAAVLCRVAGARTVWR